MRIGMRLAAFAVAVGAAACGGDGVGSPRASAAEAVTATSPSQPAEPAVEPTPRERLAALVESYDADAGGLKMLYLDVFAGIIDECVTPMRGRWGSGMEKLQSYPADVRDAVASFARPYAITSEFLTRASELLKDVSPDDDASIRSVISFVKSGWEEAEGAARQMDAALLNLRRINPSYCPHPPRCLEHWQTGADKLMRWVADAEQITK